MSVIINGSNTPTAGGVTYGDGTQYATTAAGSAGGVLYSAGSSAPAFTAAGTSGQVLTSAGASAPTWSTPSSSALVFLSSTTVSTPVASVTLNFNSTYNDYIIEIDNLYWSATGDRLSFRFVTGSVEDDQTYTSSGYGYRSNGSAAATASATSVGYLQSSNLANTSGAGKSTSAYLTVSGINSSSLDKTVFSNFVGCYQLTSDIVAGFVGVRYNNGTNPDKIRFFNQSAGSIDITAGTFKLYGVAKS